MTPRMYTLDITTQGPLYPPSEVMDEDGNFIVIGAINRAGKAGTSTEWGGAIVSSDSRVPAFGQRAPYKILEEFGNELPSNIGRKILHTLPLPLPCANYPMLFAPDQYPYANEEIHPSYAFHKTPIPDLAEEHGRQLEAPVTLQDWVRAKGRLTISIVEEGRSARFQFQFKDLLPRSLYSIMSLRERDLNPNDPTRPAPLGIPNVFVTDADGSAGYDVVMPNPFPSKDVADGNRIVNVVVLWMSYQMSHGGAIGRYGLGGDIHAQLKFKQPMFLDLETYP